MNGDGNFYLLYSSHLQLDRMLSVSLVTLHRWVHPPDTWNCKLHNASSMNRSMYLLDEVFYSDDLLNRSYLAMGAHRKIPYERCLYNCLEVDDVLYDFEQLHKQARRTHIATAKMCAYLMWLHRECKHTRKHIHKLPEVVEKRRKWWDESLWCL